MRKIRLLAVAAIALAGCVEQQPAAVQYPQPMQYSGPPGGQMDPAGVPTEEQYEQDSQTPQQQAYPQAYADPAQQEYAPDDQGQAQDEPVPSADPQDPGYAMGPVGDAEIDATLDGYGGWSEDPDYGRVWRPDATVVGADFTPYETCGEWVWTDWGWSFNCDYSWGWLPFHYGRWAWMDDGYWGWVPGHEWSPAWVDWRHGGGYVGWRPRGPEVRDHRGQHTGPVFHDHRTGSHDSQWRFVSTNDFGKGHIRGHLYNDLAEGLRVTSPVTRPPLRGTTQPVRVAATMAARLSNPVWRQQHAPAGGWRQPVTAHQPGPQQHWGTIQHGPQTLGVQQRPQTWTVPSTHEPWQRQVTVPHQAPQWRQPPQQGWRQPPQQGWRQPPTRGQVWTTPPTQRPTWSGEPTQPTYGGNSTWTRPTNAPRPTFTGGTYSPPSRPSYSPQPSYSPPRPSYSPPRPSYSPPSRPSYSPPSHSWSAPSAPSHYSGGGSYGGGGHSYGGGGGGHSFGGGGHRR